jgi:DNA-directed RNA polymerase subunit N (RpoN/RPB10)
MYIKTPETIKVKLHNLGIKSCCRRIIILAKVTGKYYMKERTHVETIFFTYTKNVL